MTEGVRRREDFIVFGHRGAAGVAPENTLAGFEAGLAAGVRWLELDVQAHPEALLIFHDDTLARTTNGQGALLRTPLATLQTLDAGNGERIPTLESLLRSLKGRAGLNVELKAGPQVGVRTAEQLRIALAEGWKAEDLLVSSFDHAELRAFHDACPAIPVAPLFARSVKNAIATVEGLHADTVHLGLAAARAANVRQMRNAGLRVHVYTVNEPEMARTLKALGVSGIFTDFPSRFRDFA